MDENLKSNFHTGYIQVHTSTFEEIHFLSQYLLTIFNSQSLKFFFSFEFNET